MANAAMFTSNTVIDAGDLSWEGQDLGVSNCVLTVNGPHTVASLLPTNGAVLNHPALG